LIFSDTHTHWQSMLEPVRKHRPEWVFHLGDNHSDIRQLAAVYPELCIRAVSGNCDFAVPVGPATALDWGGVRLYLCHGHLHDVKRKMTGLAAAAKSASAKIAFYGHTHIAADDTLGGIRLINPGSPVCPRSGLPCYGLLEACDNGSLLFRHETVE
jgi:hypothetical protein